jgi:hypothetical protein
MVKNAGRNLPLSLPRQMIADMMWLGKKVPTVAVERRMNIAPLVAAREACVPRPGWCTLFTKAFAIVAARQPELRRAFLPFPWAHLYEHGCNVAGILVERRFDDEDAVFRVNLCQPEAYSLTELDAYVRRCKERPVETMRLYRRYRKLGRLPGFLRRLLFWLAISVSGPWRARNFGTFEVTSTAGAGADALHIVTPMSVVLNYGVVEATGAVNMRLVFDHRVFDGAGAARALVEMNGVLLNEILAELHSLPLRKAA